MASVLPQWHAEPVRFIEAGFAAPVPVNTVAGQPAAAAIGAPVVPASVFSDTGLRSVVERIYPTDAGLPQETAPAVPGPVGSPVIPGTPAAPASAGGASVLPERVPTLQAGIPAPAAVAEAAPAVAVATGPVAAAVAVPAADLAVPAPSGNQDSAIQPAGPNALPAGPGASAGQIGATPAAPGTPGAVVQPGPVAGNAVAGGTEVPGGAPEARRHDETPDAGLIRAQGGLAMAGGASRPAGAPGTPSPAMGNPALQAALTQLAEEIPRTPPGGIREIELRLNSEELGRVRVRLKLLDTGAVAIEFTTPTERAAQVLRQDLPQLAQTLEGRGTMLDHPQVLVAPVGQFMGNGSSGQSRQGPRWFEHRASRRNAGTPDGLEGLAAVGAYGRRWQAVDLLA